jgi:hypothetical protein
MNGAVAATGDDSVETVANRQAHLCGRVGGCTRRIDLYLDPSSLKDGLDRLYIFEPVFLPSAREGIVEKNGAAHERGL